MRNKVYRTAISTATDGYRDGYLSSRRSSCSIDRRTIE
jgi:hypothetical protein